MGDNINCWLSLRIQVKTWLIRQKLTPGIVTLFGYRLRFGRQMLAFIFKQQLYIIFLNNYPPDKINFLSRLIAKIYCCHYLINYRFSFINAEDDNYGKTL